MKTRIGSWIVITFASVASAWSQSPVGWYWNDASFAVSPTDQILLTGTIANYSAQTYVIPSSAGAGAFFGDLQPLYSISFQFDFYDKTVPASGSLFFTFGTLTPIVDSVPPGVYPGNSAYIDLTGLGLQPPLNTFEITVTPEPSPVSMGAVGLAVLLVTVIFQRSRRRQFLRGGGVMEHEDVCIDAN